MAGGTGRGGGERERLISLNLPYKIWRDGKVAQRRWTIITIFIINTYHLAMFNRHHHQNTIGIRHVCFAIFIKLFQRPCGNQPVVCTRRQQRCWNIVRFSAVKLLSLRSQFEDCFFFFYLFAMSIACKLHGARAFQCSPASSAKEANS